MARAPGGGTADESWVRGMPSTPLGRTFTDPRLCAAIVDRLTFGGTSSRPEPAATAWPTPAPNGPGMRNAFPLPPNQDGSNRTGIHCQCCGRLIVLSVQGLFQTPARGSTQRFCDSACRQAAYRRRRANAPENTPAQRQGGRRRKLNPSPGPGGAKSAPSIRGQIRLTRPARSRIRSDSIIWTPGTSQGSRTHGADGWPSAAACRKGTCPETTTDPGETASASGTGSLRRHARQLDDDPFLHRADPAGDDVPYAGAPHLRGWQWSPTAAAPVAHELAACGHDMAFSCQGAMLGAPQAAGFPGVRRGGRTLTDPAAGGRGVAPWPQPSPQPSLPGCVDNEETCHRPAVG